MFIESAEPLAQCYLRQRGMGMLMCTHSSLDGGVCLTMFESSSCKCKFIIGHGEQPLKGAWWTISEASIVASGPGGYFAGYSSLNHL